MHQSITANFVITTDRFILRPLAEVDAQAVFLYRNQPEIKRFQGWTPAGPEEVASYAQEMTSRPLMSPGFWSQLVIRLIDQPSGESTIIGDIAFCIDNDTHQQAEMGITLDKQYQHQGYALQAVTSLVNYLFSTVKLHRIHVSIDPDNQASLRLFERAGFRFEGHLKQSVWFHGAWCDDIIMAMLHEDWTQRDRPT